MSPMRWGRPSGGAGRCDPCRVHAHDSRAGTLAVDEAGGDRNNVSDPQNWLCRNYAGTLLAGAIPGENTSVTVSGATTRLLDDSYFVAKTRARPHFWSTHTLDLGGHVLDVTMASGVTFDLGGVGAVGSTITNGTIRVSGGTLHTDKFKNIAMNAKTVNLQVSCALNIESIRAFDIGDYEALYTGTSNAGTGALNVYRTFKPVSTNFYGPTMQDGSTMDLRAWPESAGWPLASGFKTGAANVQFAAHSTVNVNLAGRSDLMALAKSDEPYIVTWDSAPSDVAFTLDAETAMLGFKLRPRAEGLRLERTKGMVIIVK